MSTTTTYECDGDGKRLRKTVVVQYEPVVARAPFKEYDPYAPVPSISWIPLPPGLPYGTLGDPTPRYGVCACSACAHSGVCNCGINPSVSITC